MQACMPSFCQNTLMTSKYVLEFCNKTNAKVNGRCCLEKQSSSNVTVITGLDYTNCNMHTLATKMQTLPRESLKNITIFDIRDNAFTECGNEAFAGLLNLETLYYPLMCQCPGGDYSWSNVQNGTCTGRLDLCSSNFSTNVRCTDKSECEENGPGNFLCKCKEGYHGYKCLQQGTFPKLSYTLIVCGGTLFLCAFLWHSQRRLVRKIE